MVLTLQERVRLVFLYCEHGNSPTATIREYRNRFGVRNICSTSTVMRLIEKFRRTGSVLDEKSPGRPPIPAEQVDEILIASQEIAATNHYGESSTTTIAEI